MLDRRSTHSPARTVTVRLPGREPSARASRAASSSASRRHSARTEPGRPGARLSAARPTGPRRSARADAGCSSRPGRSPEPVAPSPAPGESSGAGPASSLGLPAPAGLEDRPLPPVGAPHGVTRAHGRRNAISAAARGSVFSWRRHRARRCTGGCTPPPRPGVSYRVKGGARRCAERRRTRPLQEAVEPTRHAAGRLAVTARRPLRRSVDVRSSDHASLSGTGSRRA
jgi:hypothetical protein